MANEDDINIILNNGSLDYLDPVSVAREFINYLKSQNNKNKAILNAAKISSHFDTTKAFFNEVSHRRNNNRL